MNPDRYLELAAQMDEHARLSDELAAEYRAKAAEYRARAELMA